MIVSVTGHPGTGRSTLYEKLKHSASVRFPETQFAFVGNPFRKLEHPLFWDEAKQGLDATTRLLHCWAHLNEVRCRQLQEALEDGKVVITDGFGLDALLYAAAYGCDEEVQAAEELHHGLVQLRLKQFGIQPPKYLLIYADVEAIDTGMVERTPELMGVVRQERKRLILRQQNMIERYFDPKHGQNPPHRLNAELAPEEMCEAALEIIGQHLRESTAARNVA